MQRYRVRLREDWRWPTAQVQGREFTKEPVELQEAELSEEIRSSPLLVVEEMDTDREDGTDSENALGEGVNATEAARFLAEQEGLLLGAIVGTGAGGRVTKRDVERALGEGAGDG